MPSPKDQGKTGPSHPRRQIALDATIQLINVSKDLVPSELGKGLLSALAGILVLLQVHSLYAICFDNQLINPSLKEIVAGH